MALDRFELLELRRDDGIQTFHAREVSTARPVQVHLFVPGNTPDEAALLSRMDRLPPSERRRVVDRGVSGGRAYVVTDRLAGFASFREWIDAKAVKSLDEQFLQLFDTHVPAEPEKVLPEETKKAQSPSLPFAAKAVLAVVLGVAAALAFLALVMAVFAFHLW